MAILLDPPRWPAHGTMFSHLVSDTSAAELHAFAASAGLDRRAFDLDHYDVPARRYDELVALGAQPVPASELVRRLRASGLRVVARRRPARVRRVLAQRWQRMFAGAADPRLDEIRDDLLERWSQPHRRYHDLTHLLEVLTALDELSGPADGAVDGPISGPIRGPVEPTRPVLLAAWFHDAVYDGRPDDEERSAELARTLLDSLVPDGEVVEVQRLVLLTREHRPEPGDADGALLSDADLAVLGGTAAEYARYVAAVRADYAHVDDAAWRQGRTALLRALLATEPLFRTGPGRRRFESAARVNLRSELDALGG